MLKELKFVMGAVAKKEFVPAMTHFAIEKGRVRSFNGTLALSSPIPFDIDCKPKATTLVKAIQQCKETVSLHITPSGKLSVKSGVFKALIDCVQDDTPHVQPEGEHIELDGEALLKAFKSIYTFVGDDASRPWTNGILLRGQSAYATNNVCLVEYWIGAHFPRVVNLPRAAIAEIIRIDEPPTHAQSSENSFTFHYSDGRWIRTQLFSTDWPDLEPILNRVATPTAIDTRIFDALESLKPFADKTGRVIFEPGYACTHIADEEGSRYELEGSDMKGIYAIEMLALLNGVASTADFSTYPKPCIFYGDRLRGAIIGRTM